LSTLAGAGERTYLTPKVSARVADDRRMSRGTFHDIRRRFGTIVALNWAAMLWRWGLLRGGARRSRVIARYARRRPASRAMLVVQWVVLATVGGTWGYWAFLTVKGVINYLGSGH